MLNRWILGCSLVDWQWNPNVECQRYAGHRISNQIYSIFDTYTVTTNHSPKPTSTSSMMCIGQASSARAVHLQRFYLLLSDRSTSFNVVQFLSHVPDSSTTASDFTACSEAIIVQSPIHDIFTISLPTDHPQSHHVKKVYNIISHEFHDSDKVNKIALSEAWKFLSFLFRLGWICREFRGFEGSPDVDGLSLVRVFSGLLAGQYFEWGCSEWFVKRQQVLDSVMLKSCSLCLQCRESKIVNAK